LPGTPSKRAIDVPDDPDHMEDGAGLKHLSQIRQVLTGSALVGPSIDL